MNLTPEHEAEIRSKVNPLYRDQRGTESHERAMLLGEIDRLRAEVAELRQDADRLELLASRGASIVKRQDGYYLYWHTSNRAGPTMPAARSAIDAALAKYSSHE